MKLGISFLLWSISSIAVAGPIKIFYESDSNRAEVVKEIFTKTYHIPEDLIALREVPSCEGLKEKGKLNLCLNDNGDLLIVSVDSGFVSESLKIFRAP